MTVFDHDQLEVIWTFPDGHEFIPGLNFYCLRPRGIKERCAFPSKYWGGDVNVQDSLLFGEQWEVPRWEVRVMNPPTDGDLVRRVRWTLESLCSKDCLVAWAGDGHTFSDPPVLFLPSAMSNGVLAAYSESLGFKLDIPPDGPINALSDEDLLVLRADSRGLASGS